MAITANLVRYPSTRMPTFVESQTQSSIDHWLLSSDVLVSSCVTLNDFTAQHRPLRIDFCVSWFEPAVLDQRGSNLCFPPDVMRMVHAQLVLLSNSLSGVHRDVEVLSNSIVGAFQSYGIERNVPRVRPTAEAWMNFLPDDLKETLADMAQSHSRIGGLLEQGRISEVDLALFRRQYRDTLNQARKVAEKRIGAFLARRAKGRFACWDLIKRLRNPPLAVAIDAYTMQEHFIEVFHDQQAALILSLDHLNIHEPPDFVIDLFSDSELVKALNALNSQAATGPQRISSRYIKQAFKNDQTRAPLLLLFNTCFAYGLVPISWGESEVFVLYKGKGDKANPTNYRFINLNNDFLRLYERLLQIRFDSWLRTQLPWGPMQFGFTPGVSTEDALVCLRTLALAFTRGRRIPCYANFLDLRKAFPSVDRAATLRALHEMGVPYELIRAFASTFSRNSARLVINGGLTGSLLVNKGTKEGGINSPPIFNSAYSTILARLDIYPFPNSSEALDNDAVYYIVFADDLVLLSANLTNLEKITNDLQQELARLGMLVNPDKTKWIMFTPSNPIEVPRVESLSLRLGTHQLEMLEEFLYLGFTIDFQSGLAAHVERREGLLLTAARLSGRLMRQLQVTNFDSLRAYFISLVSSQLYGLSCANFNSEVYQRAQKIFLEEAFNLPQSFPIQLAVALLNLDDLELLTFRARARFLRHVMSSNTAEASLNAIILDRERLFPQGIGWFHDFVLGVPSLPNLRSANLSALTTLDSYESELRSICHERLRSRLYDSSLRHIIELFGQPSVPRALGVSLGELSFELVRTFLIFLANLIRFSFFQSPDALCPLCNGRMFSRHFFLCEDFQPFEEEHIPWGALVRDHMDECFQELEFIQEDRRHAALLPNIAGFLNF